MKRETGKHGHKCRTSKTIKCCESCKIGLKSDKICGVIVNKNGTFSSLNKKKNWEILENLKQKPTQKRSQEFEIEDKIYVAKPYVWDVLRNGFEVDYLIVIPQDEHSISQQTKLCPKRKVSDYYSYNDRLKKKYNNKNLTIDFVL